MYRPNVYTIIYVLSGGSSTLYHPTTICLNIYSISLLNTRWLTPVPWVFHRIGRTNHSGALKAKVNISRWGDYNHFLYRPSHFPFVPHFGVHLPAFEREHKIKTLNLHHPHPFNQIPNHFLPYKLQITDKQLFLNTKTFFNPNKTPKTETTFLKTITIAIAMSKGTGFQPAVRAWSRP